MHLSNVPGVKPLEWILINLENSSMFYSAKAALYVNVEIYVLLIALKVNPEEHLSEKWEIR